MIFPKKEPSIWQSSISKTTAEQNQFSLRSARQRGRIVRCRDIIGFDVNSMEEGNADLSSLKGLLTFGLRGGKNMCDEVVGSAVEELLDLLEDWDA